MAGNTRSTNDCPGHVTCLSNDGYAVSLVPGKAYVVVPDAAAESKGLIRIIDESEEDYLYPAGQFVRSDGFEEPLDDNPGAFLRASG